MKWTAGKSLTQNFYFNEKRRTDNERENLRCPDRHGICFGWRSLPASFGTVLDTVLADVEEQAAERYEVLIEQLSQQEGISEKLKEENQMEWVGRMKNLENRAAELVKVELIYTFERR